MRGEEHSLAVVMTRKFRFQQIDFAAYPLAQLLIGERSFTHEEVLQDGCNQALAFRLEIDEFSGFVVFRNNCPRHPIMPGQIIAVHAGPDETQHQCRE